ncbi:MAG: CTP--molybdopterin cytidylyltransferase [Cereibacter sphaeroides]|uniref:CTP--molybdopterin cytidylyltransferase n=1 Tax=Cereibacter sphaeroides TaxID=1063 RepID=A0A2W5S9I7_CERSP|nr:MAG: CTP--molybdopterin cytidylyltransferase [Cereibacter sphaeroides]
MTRPAILIPAAGGSSRMRGGDKLMELVEGEPMIRRQARIAAETGCPVFVTLAPDRPLREAALAGLDLLKVAVPDATTGMSASLRRGVATASALPDCPGVMILPADMPEFTTDILSAMSEAFLAQPDRILRGASGDQPGHPAIFPADLWPELLQISGDQGGISVIRAHPERVVLIALPDRVAITDLDTPEDWAAWRSRT